MHNNNDTDRDYDDANAVAVAASRPVLNTWLRGPNTRGLALRRS